MEVSDENPVRLPHEPSPMKKKRRRDDEARPRAKRAKLVDGSAMHDDVDDSDEDASIHDFRRVQIVHKQKNKFMSIFATLARPTVRRHSEKLQSHQKIEIGLGDMPKALPKQNANSYLARIRARRDQRSLLFQTSRMPFRRRKPKPKELLMNRSIEILQRPLRNRKKCLPPRP
jgi:hypothetical protein